MKRGVRGKLRKMGEGAKSAKEKVAKTSAKMGEGAKSAKAKAQAKAKAAKRNVVDGFRRRRA